MPELAEVVTDIIIQVKVPLDARDDTCLLTLVITDNDKNTPLESTQTVEIFVVSQKFQGVEIPAVPNAVVTNESPLIVDSKINLVGETTIKFNRAIELPEKFYELTSDNDGPVYFNVTLVVHPDNLLAFEKLDQPSP